MATKRAAGGGRKPSGPHKGKSSVFSTRITPELREALEAAAKKSGHSISQIVETRLRDSFQAPKQREAALGQPHIRALAYLAARCAAGAEIQTRKRWHNDKFTFECMLAALTTVLASVRPEGEAEVPEAIQERADQMRKLTSVAPLLEHMEYMLHPETSGMALGNGIIDQLSMLQDAPPLNSKDVYAQEFYLMPFIVKALALADEGSPVL